MLRQTTSRMDNVEDVVGEAGPESNGVARSHACVPVNKLNFRVDRQVRRTSSQHSR